MHNDTLATGERYLPEKLRDAERKFEVKNLAVKLDKSGFVRRHCADFHALLLAHSFFCIGKTLSVAEQEVNKNYYFKLLLKFAEYL